MTPQLIVSGRNERLDGQIDDLGRFNGLDQLPHRVV
jgi:hypothetical protein